MVVLDEDSSEATPDVPDNTDNDEVDIDEVDELVELVVPELFAVRSNNLCKLVDDNRS